MDRLRRGGAKRGRELRFKTTIEDVGGFTTKLKPRAKAR
jgi:hypothetical protein